MANRIRSNRKGISRSWFVLGILYALFFYWYTPFGGPLSDDEIAHYTAVLEDNPATAEYSERWIQFMKSDTGGDFAMWNAVDMLDTPKQIEGVEPGDTSYDVVNRYAEPFFTQGLLSAAHPVFGGTAANPALDIWGIEGGDEWDSGLLVRYRSRRDIMETIEMMSNSGDDLHAFKIAAVKKTIAFPLDPWGNPGDPRILLALVFIIIGLIFQLRRNARA